MPNMIAVGMNDQAMILVRRLPHRIPSSISGLPLQPLSGDFALLKYSIQQYTR